MTNMTDATSPSGARAYTTPDREFIGRLVLESRTAPTDPLILQKLHGALMSENDPHFIAQACIYASREAGNRDMGMALLAFIYARAKSLTGEPRTNWFRKANETLPLSMMSLGHLRSFLAYYRGPAQEVQGRWGYSTGIGGSLQKALKRWINNLSEVHLIRNRAGTAPTTRDIFRMVHPGTDNPQRNNLYRWITKNEVQTPISPLVLDLERLKRGEIPHGDSAVWTMPLDLLGPAIGDNVEGWRAIAQRCNVKQLLKNLNTFARQLIYADNPELVTQHCNSLESQAAIENSGISCYEVFRAVSNADEAVPAEIKASLDRTLELSFGNLPQIAAPIVILVDVSGSMQQPLGSHRGKNSALRRCDAAGLIASALTQVSPDVVLVPFDTRIRSIEQLARAEGVAGKASAIARFMGGGTNVGMAFEYLNQEYNTLCPSQATPNIILLSDNMSLPHFDISPLSFGARNGHGTRAQEAWNRFTQTHEGARLLLLDIAVDGTQQVNNDNPHITGMAGWSPATFKLINHWVQGASPQDEAAEPVDIIETILNFRLEVAATAE